MTLIPLSTAQLEKVKKNNDAFAGGIKDGGDFLPTLSTKGRQFHIRQNKQSVSLDGRTLDVILVAARSSLSKAYYAGQYQPGQAKAPDCKSVDGIRPDADVKSPQNSTCTTCRMNAWGSKINPTTGAEGKACSDYKLLILAPPDLDGSSKPLQIGLPSMSLKNKDNYTESLGAYIKLLTHNNLGVTEVVTRLGFTDDAYPRLTFNYVRNLNAEEAAKVVEIAAREDVVAAIGEQPAALAETEHASEPPTVLPENPLHERIQTTVVAPAASAGNVAVNTPESAAPSEDVADILSKWSQTAK